MSVSLGFPYICLCSHFWSNVDKTPSFCLLIFLLDVSRVLLVIVKPKTPSQQWCSGHLSRDIRPVLLSVLSCRWNINDCYLYGDCMTIAEPSCQVPFIHPFILQAFAYLHRALCIFWNALNMSGLLPPCHFNKAFTSLVTVPFQVLSCF